MVEPRWLDEEEAGAWRAFLAAGALVDRRLELHLREEWGLSHPQYEVLVRLAAAPAGRERMTDLADAMLVSKSGLTYQVGQLEKAGLVRRQACDTDERGVEAVLTKAGRRRLEQVAPSHVTVVREILIDVLTPAQRRALTEGLGEVARRLGHIE